MKLKSLLEALFFGNVDGGLVGRAVGSMSEERLTAMGSNPAFS